MVNSNHVLVTNIHLPYKNLSDTDKKKTTRSTYKDLFPQFLAAISGTLFAVSDGLAYAWTSPYIPYLLSKDSHIATTAEVVEWLETVLMCGSLCGLPITIILTNTVGRKKSLLIASFVIALTWLTILLGDRIEYLFVARFFAGVCGNIAFVAGPMYVAEIAEQHIRGLLSGIIYIMGDIGSLIVYCVAPYFAFYVSPIIGGGFAVLELLIFSFVPESPYFLLYKNKPDEAEKSLKYFRPNRNIEQELNDISKSIEIQKKDKGRLLNLLLLKSNRKALLIMTVLNSGQHLCAYTVILMNLHSILDAAGSIYMEPSIAAILVAVIMLLATTFASFQIDKYGRKILLIVSSIMTGICLLTIAIYYNLKLLNFDVLHVSWIPIVSVMAYSAAFKIGVGTVPIVITGEIFPAKLKTMSMTIADGMYLVGGVISIQLYQVLSKFYGIHVPFYIFAFSSFFIAIFTIFYIPETKGKSLQDIQDILSYETLEDDDL